MYSYSLFGRCFFSLQYRARRFWTEVSCTLIWGQLGRRVRREGRLVGWRSSRDSSDIYPWSAIFFLGLCGLLRFNPPSSLPLFSGHHRCIRGLATSGTAGGFDSWVTISLDFTSFYFSSQPMLRAWEVESAKFLLGASKSTFASYIILLVADFRAMLA